MLCTNGCRGGRSTFTGWENVLLFNGGRRILTKSETTLKSNYAFIGGSVKFCEVWGEGEDSSDTATRIPSPLTSVMVTLCMS
jgi:hypothetical protein